MLDMDRFAMEYEAAFNGYRSNPCYESALSYSGCDISTLRVGEGYKLTNQEKMNPDNIKRVIFNFPATIVIYSDDTKTVVKCNDEDFDEEKGLAMIFLNLAFDNNKSARKRFVEGAILENYKGVSK